MKESLGILTAVSAFIVLFAVPVARAESPIDPASVTATASSVNYQLEAVYSCNGNGLVGDMHTNDISTGSEPPEAGEGTMWLSNGIGGQWISYQFDDVYTLSGMWVWNYNQVTSAGGYRTNRGIRECTIDFSLDGVDWERLGGTFTLAEADGSDTYAHNTEVDLGLVKAKYLRINVVSNHGGTSAGLSEVRFFHAGTVVSFQAAGSAEPEHEGSVAIGVALSEASDQAVSVDYAVTGGTALEGDDYTLRGSCFYDLNGDGLIDFLDLGEFSLDWLHQGSGSGADAGTDQMVNFRDFSALASEWLLQDCGGNTLRFEPGSTGRDIYVGIHDDGLEEDDETFIIELSNPAGGDILLGQPSQHTYTIEDPRPRVGFALPAGSAAEGAGPVDIEVTLSGLVSGIVTVEYSATGGTAVNGDDYTLSNGMLTFEQGQTVKYITVDILQDAYSEGAETVEIALSNAANAIVGDNSSHILTIFDSDQLVLLEEFVGESFSTENHSATIAQTSGGALVVAWYGGSHEGENDVSIWASRNDGSGWSSRVMVDDGDGQATWNPVLFQPSVGPLLLYYKYTGDFKNWLGVVKKSFDDGITWSGRINLPSCGCSHLSAYGGRYVGPVKNKPLELPDGTLLCGSSTEHDGWRTHMELAAGDYTNDFTLVGPLGGGGIQPTFLVHTDDYLTIQTVCRSGNRPTTAWSYDAGRTWTSLTELGIDANAGLDAVTVTNLGDGVRWFVLAHNPTEARTPLAIAVSRDGVNWNLAVPDLDSATGGVEYPSIIQTADKMLHVVFSWRDKEKIKHMVLNPYVLFLK